MGGRQTSGQQSHDERPWVVVVVVVARAPARLAAATEAIWACDCYHAPGFRPCLASFALPRCRAWR